MAAISALGGVGTGLLDYSCGVPMAGGQVYTFSSISELENHPTDPNACQLKTTSYSDGLVDSGLMQCNPESSHLNKPPVVSEVGVQATSGRQRCILSLTPNLSRQQYQAFETELRDLAVTRSNRYTWLRLLYEKLQRDFAQLQAIDQRLGREIQAKEQIVAQLQSEVNTLEAELRGLQGTINGLVSQINEWGGRVSNLNMQRSQMDSEASQARQQADSLQQQARAREAQSKRVQEDAIIRASEPPAQQAQEAVQYTQHSVFVPPQPDLPPVTTVPQMAKPLFPASPVPPPPKVAYRVTSALRNNFCVDAPYDHDGSHVHMWDCVGQPNQRWWGSGPGSSVGNFVFQNEKNKRCLDVGPNDTAVINKCSGSATQRSSFNSMTGEIKNNATGKCLDVKGLGWTNATPLIWYGCNGGKNQKFSFA